MNLTLIIPILVDIIMVIVSCLFAGPAAGLCNSSNSQTYFFTVSAFHKLEIQEISQSRPVYKLRVIRMNLLPFTSQITPHITTTKSNATEQPNSCSFKDPPVDRYNQNH